MIVVLNRVALMLCMVVMMLGVSYGMHAHSLAVFAKADVGATYEDLASLGVAKFLPYVLVPFLIGLLLSRVNNGYVIIIGVALHAVSLLLVSAAETIAEVLLWQTAIGAAHAFIWPSVNTILSHDSRTRVRYIARALLSFLVGIMLGPLIGSGIMDATGENYRLLFQLAAVAMSSSSIAVMLMRGRLPSPKKLSLDVTAYGKILRFPAVMGLTFFMMAICGFMFVIHPAFLTDHGLSVSSVLFLYFLYGAVHVASMVLVNYLHKWTTAILTAAVAMVTVGLFISLVGTSFAHFAVAIALMAFNVVAYPMCLEVVLARTKRNIANKMVAAYASLTGFGWFLGPTIAGHIAHWFGPAAPYWAFCIAGACMTVVAATLHKTLAGVEARHKKVRSVSHSLKDQFGVMLLSLGLLNQSLAKADAYEDVSSKIKTQRGYLSRTMKQIDENLDIATDLLDPASVRGMGDLLDRIKAADLESGVGKGYPDYAEIKDDLKDYVDYLDEEMNVDAVVDVRKWLHAKPKKRRS